MSRKCPDLDKGGKPCPFFCLDGFDRCPSHAAKAGDPMAKLQAAVRSRNGGAKAARLAAERRRVLADSRVDLSTADRQRDYLERAAGISMVTRDPAHASIAHRIVESCRGLLDVETLRRENAELKKFVRGRHPELVGQFGL